ncbi:MAG: four helix bundle protein [Deltaproteobacteria bacterium]|nr:four helix bundle protein [Deltaproteobacteria bacterium]
MKFNFEKLDVYQDAIEFANNIYKITKPYPKNEIFGITNQTRRASISIPTNIAEGSSRGKKEFIHFLNIALGSAYECVPLLEISRRQGYLRDEMFNKLIDELHKISAKINALKNSLRK